MPSLTDPAVALAVQLAESVAAGNSSAAREITSSAVAPALAAIEGSWSTAGGEALSMTVEPSGQLTLKAADGKTLASGSLAVGSDGSTVSLTFANGTTAVGTMSEGVPPSIAWSSGGLEAWTQTSGNINAVASDEAKAKASASYTGKFLTDQDFNSEVNARAHTWKNTHSNTLAHTLAENTGTCVRMYTRTHARSMMGRLPCQ